MYPDLYKGLNLIAYDSPVMSFEGKTVTPMGQIRLPIQTGSEMVEVDFIVVHLFTLHSYCGQTLALCLRNCFLYLELEGKIFIKWLGSRNCGESVHG